MLDSSTSIFLPNQNLSDQEIKNFENIFSSIDKQQRCQLNNEDFKIFLKNIHFSTIDSDIFFAAYDISGECLLSFRDVLMFLSDKKACEETGNFTPIFQKIFRGADRDKDGYLNFQELKSFIEKCHLELSDQRLTSLMKRCEPQGMAYDQWLKIIHFTPYRT
jgi:Ca2+-binding EF-hand superfamily protein